MGVKTTLDQMPHKNNIIRNPADLKERIQALAARYFEEAVSIRRHLHQYPELSFQEFQTQAYISQKLTEWGIEHEKVANTGVLATIRSTSNPEKAVCALRSDHDALPILEKNDVDYKSKNTGVQHACGHDAHTAANLIAAKILFDVRDEFEGTVKCLFQPAEEVVKVDGTAGALLMMDSEPFSNPRPASIIAQHVNPFIDCGKIALKPGPIMAAVDMLEITITGKGGHAAWPHSANDPVPVTALIQSALQLIVSRYNNPLNPMVLSISSSISESTAFNVLSSEVKMLGTLRTYNEAWRAEVHERIRKIVHSIAEAFDATAHCYIQRNVPFVDNDEKLTQRITEACVRYLGHENVLPINQEMTGEDFAYYSQKMPACFYWLGVRNESLGITSALHTSTMNIDEQALEIGSGLMAFLATEELRLLNF